MDEIEALRQDILDPSYKKDGFIRRDINIYNSKLPSTGTSVPHIKEVAKKYAVNEKLILNDIPLSESVEMTMVFLMIGLEREKAFAKKMDFLRSYLPLVDSWAETDLCPQFIKLPPLDEYKPYFEEFIRSPYPYLRRFAYVYAIGYYRDPRSSYFLKHIKKEKEDCVTLAEAWLLATMAITNFDKVVSFLKSDCPTASLKKKTISKCLESFRLTEEEKTLLRALRSN
jgi:3-methyladenine DNA glycosylase AlkD